MLQVVPVPHVTPPDEQVHPAMVTRQLPQPPLPSQVVPLLHVLPAQVNCVPPLQVEPVHVVPGLRQVLERGLQVGEFWHVTLHVTLPSHVTDPTQVGEPLWQVYIARQVVSHVLPAQVVPIPPQVAPLHVALHVIPLRQQVRRVPQVTPPEHVGPLQVR